MLEVKGRCERRESSRTPSPDSNMIATTEKTHGELIKIENEVPAGTPGVPMHYHLSITGSFYVLESRLDVYVGRQNHVELSAGQSGPGWCAGSS